MSLEMEWNDEENAYRAGFTYIYVCVMKKGGREGRGGLVS